MTIAIPIIIESSTALSDIIISGVGSGGAPGAGAPADLASFPGRFVGGGQSAWERGYRTQTIII